MDIDIHITNATPEDIKKIFQAISGSKERRSVSVDSAKPLSADKLHQIGQNIRA